MKLSLLATILGVGFAVPQLVGLKNPAAFKKFAREFPRSMPWGCALMLVATAWFIYNLSKEQISDFAPYKNFMFAGFTAIGLATCFFVRDFLAARGLAILLMLLAKVVVDSARWVENDWRLVLVTWAYVWVVGGIWVTISPWKLRDWLNWLTETPERIKIGCALRLAFGVLVLALGLFSL